MKNLMQKIMLSCKQATFFSSIRNFKKLKLVQQIQLRLHFMACKSCNEFDKQSWIIDQTLIHFQKNEHLQSSENLSDEKILQIKYTVNQNIN